MTKTERFIADINKAIIGMEVCDHGKSAGESWFAKSDWITDYYCEYCGERSDDGINPK